MNAVKRKIISEINISKGIFLDEFIDICLFSQDGYYKKAKPIGKKGDFTTSPLISNIFSDILAVWCIAFWESLGKPTGWANICWRKF